MPYNPGNIRKLNALGGKRPQATGIAILPKNGDRTLATSEGSVNNYGGNNKMGLYSNVGMNYQFQNLNLTGQRLNGNMPYFWGGSKAITKSSNKAKNMITVTMLDDGDQTDDNGTIGFVSHPYWAPLSTQLETDGSLDSQHVKGHMGRVNGKIGLQHSTAKIIAVEMWRGTNGGGSLGPVNYSVAPGIHIWAEGPITFGSVVFKQGSKMVTLKAAAVYDKDNLPASNSAADGNANNAVRASLIPQAGKYYFPATYTSQDDRSEIPSTTTVYWLPFPSATRQVNQLNAAGQIVSVTVPNKPGVDARAIFPRRSRTDATATASTDISKTVAMYFQ